MVELETWQWILGTVCAFLIGVTKTKNYVSQVFGLYARYVHLQ